MRNLWFYLPMEFWLLHRHRQQYCRTPGLGLRLGGDFVLSLSQEEEEEQEPPSKSIRRGCTTGWSAGTDKDYALIAWARKQPMSWDRCPFAH